MQYTTLVATNLLSRDTAVSIDLEDEEQYRLEEGMEFLKGVQIRVQGALLEDDESYDEVQETLNLVEAGQVDEICEISGMLIFGKDMVQEGYSPYSVCDDYSVDLEFVYSILKEYDLEKNGGETNNIFYIEDISWSDNVDLSVKRQVIKQLKGFMINIYSFLPNVICFYTAPTEEYRKEKVLSEQRNRLMAKKFETIMNDEDAHLNSNVIDLHKHIGFSEEEINERLGRRNSGESYPEEFINKVEYEEFCDMDFEEIENSRLMFRMV